MSEQSDPPSRGADDDGEKKAPRRRVRFWTERRIKIALLLWETVLVAGSTAHTLGR